MLQLKAHHGNTQLYIPHASPVYQFWFYLWTKGQVARKKCMILYVVYSQEIFLLYLYDDDDERFNTFSTTCLFCAVPFAHSPNSARHQRPKEPTKMSESSDRHSLSRENRYRGISVSSI